MSEDQKNNIREHLYKAGFLPLFSHPDRQITLEIVRALYNGGVRVIEFTNRPHEALDIFRWLKKNTAERMPGLALGAGTILNEEQANSFSGEGADFLVSPVTDEEVGTYCISKNIFWCPGAATPTEILHAHKLGADLVKVFPAEQLGGPEYIRSVMAPCPWLKLMPTGGVKPQKSDLESWYKAGAKVVGVSSRLFTREIMESGNFESITARVESLLNDTASINRQNKNLEDHVNK